MSEDQPEGLGPAEEWDQEAWFGVLIEKVSSSAFVIVLLSDSGVDPKLAIEVGLAAIYGKRIIVVVYDGAEVPAGLAGLAQEVVPGSFGEEPGAVLLEAILRVTDSLGPSSS